MDKVKVAIIGPGNIGTDLMFKILRSKYLELTAMIGVIESEGIKRARDIGINTSVNGIEYVKENPEIADIFFDATTARAHIEMNAPILDKLRKIVIDLTPAAIGKIVTPMVNMEDALKVRNVNLITCGGQATTPIVYAISKVMKIKYAEVVTSVASKSAGPGTRNNIDEYTDTTAKALVALGGAETAKVMTLFNPAVPEVAMRNTIFCISKGDFNLEEVEESVRDMVNRIKEYVPGYTLTLAPKYDGEKITTIITVNGAGDFLPSYAGNLDIETSSAVKIAELYAQNILKNGGDN